MTIQGRIPYAFLSSAPLSRDRVHALLDRCAKNGGLTGPDAARLREFQREFGDPATVLHYDNGSQRVAGRLQWTTLGVARDSLPRGRGYVFSVFTAGIRGSVLPGLEFLSEASVGQERSNEREFIENYDPRGGLPYNTPALRTTGDSVFGFATFDAFRSVVGWESPHVALEAGVDWNQWGPGIWQHAAVSQRSYFWVQDSTGVDFPIAGPPPRGRFRQGYRLPGESAPMTQIRLRMALGAFHYTKFLGEKTGLTRDSGGFLVGHRLEATAGGGSLGVFEILSYDRDELEWTYAVPLVPLFMAEHQLGDRDNVGLGLDVQYIWTGLGRIYAEIFFDDLIGPLDVFDDYWGNKFAWTLGVESAGWLLPGAVWQAEYSRVEAWTYSHFTLNNQLQHYGSLTGSHIPPNAHVLHLRWRQHLSLPVKLGLEYAFHQRQHFDRGSSIFHRFDPEVDDPRKDFLGTNSETRHAILVDAAYAPLYLLSLEGFAGYDWVSHWKSTPRSNPGLWSLGASLTLRY